jgi:acetylglutamate synthase
MRHFLYKKLTKAKDVIKRYYDKNHLKKVFRVGDLVYVRAKHIKTGRPSKKLDTKMIGPFAIINKSGSQSYRLNLPPLLRYIHPTFHVSMLEQHYRDSAKEGLAPIIIDGQPEYKVKRILAHKGTKSRIYRVK